MFFFADSESLPNQKADAGYGPISLTQYRTTAIFSGEVTANKAPMAIAVTTGKIMLVRNTADQSINLILKPTGNVSGVPAVRYFIYRGLDNADFFSPSSSGIKEKSTTDSELITEIRKSPDKLKALNDYQSLPETTSLDDIFSNPDNGFHYVANGGITLGRFNTQGNAYGFEIVLDSAGFDLTLATARKEVNIIDIPTSDDADVARAMTLSYLDPAAYFGCLALYNIPVTAGGKPRLGRDLYSTLKKFATCNTIYFDARDEQGNPLDWFSAKSSLIKITADSSTAENSTAQPYRNQYGYPLHIISSGFSNIVNDLFFTVNVSLPVAENKPAVVDLQEGCWEKFIWNIVDKKLLLLPYPFPRRDIPFSSCFVTSNWAKSQSFAVLAVRDGTSFLPMAAYIKVKLIEDVPEQASDRKNFNGNFYDPVLTDFRTLFDLTRMDNIHASFCTSFGIAYNVERDIANDDAGHIFFTCKSQQQLIMLHQAQYGRDSVALHEDCFIPHYSDNMTGSFYAQFVRKEVTKPHFTVYKVQAGPGKNLLEIMPYSPRVLPGLNPSPVDLFCSIAISKQEMATLKSLAGQHFIKGSRCTITLKTAMIPGSVPSGDEYDGRRSYFESIVLLKGSTRNADKTKATIIESQVMVRSVDGKNFVSDAYATAAFPLLKGTVWTNDLIPITASQAEDPFQEYRSELNKTVKAILTAAKAIAPGPERNLLNQEIRKAFYDGDIAWLTFEMAFRMPFYTRNIAQVPYRNGNTPYYLLFEQCFKAANDIRDKAGMTQEKNLSRAGHMKGFTNQIDNEWGHLNLYKLFNVKKNDSFKNHNLPAYLAAILDAENSQGMYNKYFHIPRAGRQSTEDMMKKARSIYTKDDLKNNFIITETDYQALTDPNSADEFVYAPIKNKSDKLGYYIVKPKGTVSEFYVYNKILIKTDHPKKGSLHFKDSSGITAGFGYDLGQHLLKEYDDTGSPNTNFLYVTGYKSSITNPSLQEKIVKEAFGIKKVKAVALFYTYYEEVFKLLTVDYDYATGHISAFFNNKYLLLGLSKDGLVHPAFSYFKVYKEEYGKHFFEKGTVQYFNEVEKCFFGTHLYNQSPYSLKISKAGSSTGLYFAHASNTHDIRWLKELVGEKQRISGLYKGRREGLSKFLETEAAFAHYNIHQTSL